MKRIIMKTIMCLVLIPIIFLAGVYGFRSMPRLLEDFAKKRCQNEFMSEIHSKAISLEGLTKEKIQVWANNCMAKKGYDLNRQIASE